MFWRHEWPLVDGWVLELFSQRLQIRIQKFMGSVWSVKGQVSVIMEISKSFNQVFKRIEQNASIATSKLKTKRFRKNRLLDQRGRLKKNME